MNLIAKEIKKKTRNNKRIDSHLGVPQNARGGNWSQDETKPHNAIIIMSENKPFQSHKVTYLSARGNETDNSSNPHIPSQSEQP